MLQINILFDPIILIPSLTDDNYTEKVVPETPFMNPEREGSKFVRPRRNRDRIETNSQKKPKN